MTSNGTQKLQVEIDPDHAGDKTRSGCQDDRHEELRAVHADAQDSPGKILIQSVSEMLTQSAQSVKALVSGNAAPTSSDEGGEEKTMLQSMGEKIMQSAQSFKEAVSGSTDGVVDGSSDENDAENEEQEKSLIQTVGERIAQSAQSMQEAITAGTGENGEGEEKTVLQAVGEKIVQSAKTVKDAYKGDVLIIPGDDETAEHSILVHSILD